MVQSDAWMEQRWAARDVGWGRRGEGAPCNVVVLTLFVAEEEDVGFLLYIIWPYWVGPDGRGSSSS